MDRLKQEQGVPKRIQVDNGSEFISKASDKWALENKVTLDFSHLGKPTDNAFIESFNGSFRDEADHRVNAGSALKRQLVSFHGGCPRQN